MERLPDRHRRLAQALVLLTFAAPAVVALAVLSVRAASIAGPSGRLFGTSGGEGVSAYNIARVGRGLTLYQNPRVAPYYPSTLYNAAFYRAYAAAAGLFPARVDDLVTAPRFVTLGLACAGLAALLAYSLLVVGRRDPAPAPRLAAWCVASAAAAAALGTLPGWWLLTARPDVGVAAFCTLALASVFALGPDREWAAGLTSGAFLAAAWSFKQSAVLTLAGLTLAALAGRRYRMFAGLLLPVALTAAAFVALLGPEYRFNAFYATSLSPFDPRNLPANAVRVVVKGAFPLAAAAAGLVALPGLRWLRPDEALALRACWWTTLVGGLATCCRNGSEVNYFFEFWAVVGFLAAVEARALADSASARGGRLAPAGFVLAAVALGASGLDAARLAGVGRAGSVRMGIDPGLRAEHDRARAMVGRATGPVLCQPGLWGLAWGLPFSACVWDDYPYFQEPASRRGLLEGGGLPGLLARRHFRLPGWSRLAVFTPPSAP